MLRAIPAEDNYRTKNRGSSPSRTGRYYTAEEKRLLSPQCREHFFGSEEDYKNVIQKLDSWFDRELVLVSYFKIIK